MPDTSETIYSDELTDLAAAIEPRLKQPSHAKRAALVVKTGRLALSPGAIAWICSISIHAAVFGAGVWIVTTLVHHASLPNDWGGGGGSSGGLISGKFRSQINGGIPSIAESKSAEPTAARPPLEASADIDFSSDHRTAGDLSDDTEAAPVRASAVSDIGEPRFHSQRPHAAGVGKSAAEPGRAPDANASGHAGDSGPGLPGALLGSGPPAPDYPAESKRLGEQGTVRIAIEVLSDGSVGRIQVVSDPGFPRLRDVSIKAAERLRRFKLKSAIKGGTPVAEFIVIPYEFKLR